MSKTDSRIGESKMMNCGMEATIVAYRNSHDLDVEFEDGYLSTHKPYSSFLKGAISNPNVTEAVKRVGESKMMNCGMEATIIAYRKYSDIDVQFDDDSIKYNCSYYNFSRGVISNESLGRNYTQKKSNRVGEKRLMNNGLEATIIRYQKASCIDVEFEDGTIVKNKSYAHFLNGKISKSSINHVGETKMMNCGMEATIVEYRNSRDIDVLFTDGVPVKKRTYGSFKKGEIANPNLGKFASVSHKYQSRIGEKNIMNNGMIATIVGYENYNNIIVKFEDGEIVDRTNYNNFKSGKISNPNFIISGESLFEGVIQYYLSQYGFSHFKAGDMARLGFGKYEIDIFNPKTSEGIEVDGIFHKPEKDIQKNKRFLNDHHKKLIRIRDKSLPKLDHDFSVDYYIDMNKGAFSKGFENVLKTVFITLNVSIEVDLQKDKVEISRFYFQTHAKNKRVGMKKMMNCGMEATIIEYRRSDDIDVLFEDGTIAANKSFKSFQNGEILNRNIYNEVRVGETKLMNCGMEATIVSYRGPTDIDVQFEDGTIVRNREYYRFKNGMIRNLNLIKGKHVGETKMMNCGMEATIVAYRRSDDLDVEFADGYLSTNKSYKSFRKGAISNPNVTYAVKRVGETKMMNCGMTATIIAYKDSSNIDVQFEDGAIAASKSYGNFKTGSIKHPLLGQNAAITQKHKIGRVGETKMMNCGMEATIIEYRAYKDIDVRFTDSSVVKKRTYAQFCSGTIAHPVKKSDDKER